MTDDSEAHYTTEAYLEAVRHTANRFRDLADELERDGLNVDKLATFNHSGDPHTAAAKRAIHAAVWGIANANLDRLVGAAGAADRAARTDR